MNFPIPADSHTNRIMLIQRLLLVIRKRKILPFLNRWADTSASQIYVVITIALGTCAVKGYILMIIECGECVLLKGEGIEVH